MMNQKIEWPPNILRRLNLNAEPSFRNEGMKYTRWNCPHWWVHTENEEGIALFACNQCGCSSHYPDHDLVHEAIKELQDELDRMKGVIE